MEQKQITLAIRRVRTRLIILFLAKWLLIGLVAGMFAGSLFLLFSRWLIVPNYRWWAAASVVIIFSIFAIAAWLKRPTWREAVLFMDEPTENRVSTALKYAEHDSAIAVLQRKETASVATSLAAQIRGELPLSMPRRWGIALISLLASFIILSVLPNTADEVLAQKQLEEEWIKQQEEKIADLLDQQKQTELSAGSLDPEAELAALLEEFRHMGTTQGALSRLEEALKALDESLKALERERHKTEQEGSVTEDDERADDDQNEAGDEAGAEDGSAEERSRQLEEVERHVEDIGRALAEMGLPAARELAGEGLSISSTWKEGGLASEFANLPTGEGLQPGAGRDESDARDPDTGSSGNPSAGEGAAEGQGGADGQGQGTTQAGEGASQGNGPGGGSDPGTGAGSGSGNGQGSGGHGGLQGGAGTGSRTEISTPRIFAGENEPDVDGGPVSGEGGDMEQGGKAPAEDGTATPYEQVYGVYEQEARQSIERGPIPDNMKHIVRDYFTNIKPPGGSND